MRRDVIHCDNCGDEIDDECGRYVASLVCMGGPNVAHPEFGQMEGIDLCGYCAGLVRSIAMGAERGTRIHSLGVEDPDSPRERFPEVALPV